MFDRTAFFNAVREAPFPGRMSQQQVDGQNAILDLWEAQWPTMTDSRWLAYMLATTFHETAMTMWPIEEYGKGAGHDYGKVDPETGQAYYGRGFVQLTWRENYQRATELLELEGSDDLVWHAERALDLEIAGDVMFAGMDGGWFTGKKLSDFFSAERDDPVGARIIINNDVKKNGAKIAVYHGDFLAAVDAAWAVPTTPIITITDKVIVNIQLPPGIAAAVFVNGEEYRG